MKLHLGCGQKYLEGYVNIDFPPTEHTVQTESVADRLEDITQLRFSRNAVQEVRLHHVFEHFRRPQIAAMVACWNSWMSNGGIVHIEVPDLGSMARVFVNPFSSIKAKAVAERHLFGSHEANWAAHYEGYDGQLLKYLLNSFGFEVTEIKRERWMGTYNIHIFGEKKRDLSNPAEALMCGRKYFDAFLVDSTPGESQMLEIWLEAFAKQIAAGWASE